MPWTLYRYILKDLLKLLASCAGVLVVVISFAAAIKPLSEGLLDPASLAKYVVYLAPTMLGFSMPFAGAFAATLVFHRLASDNELIACRASGMSYQTVLLPVVFLGLLLTLGLFFLSNWVVPSFYQRAAAMLEKDLTRVMVNQVSKGQAAEFGDVVLYADAVDDRQRPPVIEGSAVQPTKLIRLRGVAVGQLDEGGRFRSDSTAEAADVLLYEVGGKTWATMHLRDVMFYDAARGDLMSVEQWSVPQVLLPSPFRDNLRFMSWPQLRALADQPDRFDALSSQKYELATVVAKARLLGEIERGLKAPPPDSAPDLGGGTVTTVLGAKGEHRYEIRSPGVAMRGGVGGSVLELEGTGERAVEVAYYRFGSLSRTIEAVRGVVTIETTEAEPEPVVRVELFDARVRDAEVEGRGTELSVVHLLRSRWPTAVLGPLVGLDSAELLAIAGAEHGGSAVVGAAASGLRYMINRLFRKVVAQLHERAAQSTACLLVLLLGAVLSMLMVGNMALVVYFWSFLPAIVVVIITHSGENVATDPDVSRALGLTVMWSGNLLLAGAVGLVYRRLART